jgi:HEPN domain-containing protein
LPRKTDSHNPADWIFFAESDLADVRALAASEISHPLCQSKLAEVLEKILKAELLRQGWFLVKTHDLQELAEELRARNSDLCGEIEALCDVLADRYFTDRYPGFDLDDPDSPSLRQQTRQVSHLLEWSKPASPRSRSNRANRRSAIFRAPFAPPRNTSSRPSLRCRKASVRSLPEML